MFSTRLDRDSRRLVEKIVLGLSTAMSSGLLLLWPLLNSAAADVGRVMGSLARMPPEDALVTQVPVHFLHDTAWLVAVAAVMLTFTLALRPRWARIAASSWATAVALLVVVALAIGAAGPVYAILAGVAAWFVVSGAHVVALSATTAASDPARTAQQTDAV
jgi:hypothetical protein